MTIGSATCSKRIAQAAEPLDVTFLLAMDPDHRFQAQVRDVAMNTDVLENAGPQVLVTATVDREGVAAIAAGGQRSGSHSLRSAIRRFRVVARSVGRGANQAVFLEAIHASPGAAEVCHVLASDVLLGRG